MEILLGEERIVALLAGSSEIEKQEIERIIKQVYENGFDRGYKFANLVRKRSSESLKKVQHDDFVFHLDTIDDIRQSKWQ